MGAPVAKALGQEHVPGRGGGGDAQAGASGGMSGKGPRGEGTGARWWQALDTDEHPEGCSEGDRSGNNGTAAACWPWRQHWLHSGFPRLQLCDLGQVISSGPGFLVCSGITGL